jgi:uncharacterized protein (DUF2141 family)
MRKFGVLFSVLALSMLAVSMCATYAEIIGDVNGDGKVDIKDLALVAQAFGSYTGHPRYNPAADVNQDGWVDIRDLAMVAKNFGQTG